MSSRHDLYHNDTNCAGRCHATGRSAAARNPLYVWVAPSPSCCALAGMPAREAHAPLRSQHAHPCRTEACLSTLLPLRPIQPYRWIRQRSRAAPPRRRGAFPTHGASTTDELHRSRSGPGTAGSILGGGGSATSTPGSDLGTMAIIFTAIRAGGRRREQEEPCRCLPCVRTRVRRHAPDRKSVV